MATAIYARASTKDQTTENQVEQLRQVAAKAGWTVSAVYADVVSGSKGREQRPELDAMLKAVTRREVNRVMVWSVDRLGRSLQDLVSTMQEIQTTGKVQRRTIHGENRRAESIHLPQRAVARTLC